MGKILVEATSQVLGEVNVSANEGGKIKNYLKLSH